jgi:glycosyltransferase involved in cell wall biosynthesis
VANIRRSSDDFASVAVGVHAHAEPERLDATLRALEGPSAHRVDVLVIADDPDPATDAALHRLGLAQGRTAAPHGPPACFNLLAAHGQGAVLVLLEAGAVPAPGAIDRLADALLADPTHGIAGPSTNDAWNQQRAVRWARGTSAEVARTGRWVASRFGDATRSLAPLHSVADFCYAVRREVVDAIGGADEGYEFGPCWEMEYNVRAVRAGFADVWVCGAYVYRAPFTARRRVEEARRFEASRRRYQDSVCALRLMSKRSDYEPHCRGEECEHFAPAELLRIHRPLPPRATVAPARSPAREPARPARPSPQLVTCVMPTRNRVEFASHAIGLFQAQDYEPRELIIVDDGDDDLAARVPDDPRVRYLRSPSGESIGAKRNRACAQARGAFIAQWDDDDWYGPGRLSAQLAPLLAGRADVTGLRATAFMELDPWRFWTVTDRLHRRLFIGDVHGGTLVFARPVWERLAQYPPRSLAEDASFLTRAQARGARLQRLDGADLFVYVRHGGNAWRLQCGDFLDRTGWSVVAEPPLPAADRAFYAGLSAGAPSPPDQPLVSCIMPTADRRRWIPSAIEYFRRQDYPNRELVVLDDGDDRVADLVGGDPRIRYIGLDERLVLGAKRNRACELARGELIVHWDDDDWQAPSRLSYQVRSMLASDAGLCGSRRTLYFDPAARRAWLHSWPDGLRDWVAGNTLCYRRSLWEKVPFPSVAVGEDTRFVWHRLAGKPLALAEHRFLAAVVHADNSSRKVTDGSHWKPRPLEEVRSLLGPDWARYER